eukprot:COSAG05_NODE_1402_length_4972_cov_30.262276_3_plen_200_part_00
MAVPRWRRGPRVVGVRGPGWLLSAVVAPGEPPRKYKNDISYMEQKIAEAKGAEAEGQGAAKKSKTEGISARGKHIQDMLEKVLDPTINASLQLAVTLDKEELQSGRELGAAKCNASISYNKFKAKENEELTQKKVLETKCDESDLFRWQYNVLVSGKPPRPLSESSPCVTCGLTRPKFRPLIKTWGLTVVSWIKKTSIC